MKRIYVLMLIQILFIFTAQHAISKEAKVIEIEEIKQWGLFEEVLVEKSLLKARNVAFEIPDYEQSRASIAGFMKKDINGDGKDDFVFLVNLTTSSDPVETIVIASQKEKYSIQRLYTEWSEIDTTVRDLDGDGLYEILQNQSIFNPKVPHSLTLLWVDIYQWDGIKFIKNNRAYLKRYYISEYLDIVNLRIELAQSKMMSKSSDSDSLPHALLEDCRIALERIIALSRVDKE